MPYVNSFLTQICCNARTNAISGRPPMLQDFMRDTCCDVYAQNRAMVQTAQIEAARYKALARYKVA